MIISWCTFQNPPESFNYIHFQAICSGNVNSADFSKGCVGIREHSRLVWLVSSFPNIYIKMHVMEKRSV